MASLLGTVFRIVQQLFCSPGPGQNEQQPVQPPPPLKPDRPTYPPHGHEQKPHHPHRNDNQINHNNEHYKQLRARANEEGDAMSRCFDDSHKAYEAGDGAKAKELSLEGHVHQKEMNRLNTEASEWIFQANNAVCHKQDRPLGEVDLHGLYVKEAITHTERAIQAAQSRGDSEIRLIVGKGLHSTGNVAKLKPAIEDLIKNYNLLAQVDEENSGVLVVVLDGRQSDRALGADDITRRLERKDEQCVVM